MDWVTTGTAIATAVGALSAAVAVLGVGTRLVVHATRVESMAREALDAVQGLREDVRGQAELQAQTREGLAAARASQDRMYEELDRLRVRLDDTQRLRPIRGGDAE